MHGRAGPTNLQEAPVSELGELAKRKEMMHRPEGRAELQEARVSGLCELAKRKRRDARASRRPRFVRSTSERTRRTSEA
ncbi:hypothetical protein CDL15_Pgr020696 [Punica granatum]|uniref:Uncharacterized protein n=1 Tax=Punica granatum TaxID=22663 RepID=A0A218W852_PUNGR|nr:hypothetical protein CDL15_Pgr020696 [Punica granatum]